jgi:hypothetical protein
LSNNNVPLSIVVTIYRPSRGLTNLLSWIYNKSLSKYQIIIVHDSSDNENISELFSELKDYKNIDLLEGDFGSPGESRNAGIEQAKGNWITFWDFDDLPNLDSFSRFMKKLERSNFQVGIGSFEVVNLNDSKVISRKVFPSEVVSECLSLTFLNPGLWRWILRRDIIGQTRFSSHKMGEDQLFLAEICAHNFKIAITQAITYSYFVGDRLQQTAIKRNFINMVSVIERVINLRSSSVGHNREFIEIAFLVMCKQLLEQYRYKDVVLLLKLARKKGFAFIDLLFTTWQLRSYLQASGLHYGKNENRKAIFFFGGLGNQLFQLAFALNLAKSFPVTLIAPNDSILRVISILREQALLPKSLDNDLEVTTDLSQIQRLRRNILIRLGSSNIPDVTRLRGFSQLLGELIVNLFARERFKFIAARGVGYDQLLISRLMRGRVAIVGYLQTFVWAESVKEILEIAFSEVIRSNHKLSALCARAESEEPIFLQYRIGDYRRNPKIGILESTYFRDGIEKIDKMEKLRNVWLFSDEPSLALDSLGEHFSERIESINEEFSDIETMALLTKGKYIIISNSTFGWWGAYLGNKKSCLAPSPWFAELIEPSNLIPSYWVRGDRNKTL